LTCGGKTVPTALFEIYNDLLTAGQENHRTPAPPVHGGSSPCELGQAPQCFGHGAGEGFFYPQAEIRPDQGSNPQPAGCRRTAVTNWPDICDAFV